MSPYLFFMEIYNDKEKNYYYLLNNINEKILNLFDHKSFLLARR